MSEPRLGTTDFKRYEDAGQRLGGGRWEYQMKVVAQWGTSEICWDCSCPYRHCINCRIEV